jgi:hypothetical protein
MPAHIVMVAAGQMLIIKRSVNVVVRKCLAHLVAVLG